MQDISHERLPATSANNARSIKEHINQIFSKLRCPNTLVELAQASSERECANQSFHQPSRSLRSDNETTTLAKVRSEEKKVTFLDLPFEIRRLVYEFMFAEPDVIVTYAHRPGFQRLMIGHIGMFQPHPICHASRCIRMETLELFYQMSTFRILKIWEVQEHHFFPNMTHLVSLVKKLSLYLAECAMLKLQFPSLPSTEQVGQPCNSARIPGFPALSLLTLYTGSHPHRNKVDDLESYIGFIRCLVIFRKEFNIEIFFYCWINSYTYLSARYSTGQGLIVDSGYESIQPDRWKWERYYKFILCLDMDMDPFADMYVALNTYAAFGDIEFQTRLHNFSRLAAEDYSKARAIISQERLSYFDTAWDKNASRLRGFQSDGQFKPMVL